MSYFSEVVMHRLSLLSASCILCTGSAAAGDSFVLPDGISRAPAVILHCATGNGTAAPCGTPSQPLAISPSPTAATAANQSTEITTQQGMAQAVGTQGDPIYVSGPGSMIALLKELANALTAGVQAVPIGGQPTSRTLSLSAQISTTVFPANGTRRYIAFQAPQGSFLWVNFIGGQATPNGPDCAYFSAGTFYESSQFVNRGAITVYSPVSVTLSAWEW